MALLKVKDQMTKALVEISAGSPVTRAEKLMRENDIRHLPVFDQRQLVGVISDRDLRPLLGREEAKETKVEKLMKQNLFLVRENEPLKTVVREMFKKKYGSTIVVDAEGWTVGIFTTSDALELLDQILTEKENKTKNFRTIQDYLLRTKKPPVFAPA